MMKTTTRKKFASAALASALGLAAFAGFATPAQAAATTATFTLTAGALSITAPETSALGSVDVTETTTAATQLGAVQVTDNRGTNLGSWTAAASSTGFTTGTGETAKTIANTNVFYWSGLATATTGTAVFLPGQATTLDKVALNAAKTAFSASAIVGNNTASWNPTMNVTIPAGSVAGTYTGTVTHSVA